MTWFKCPYCSFDCTDEEVMQKHIEKHEEELGEKPKP
jgi:hypothetical protein